jgi:threonine aldolase
MRQAGYLAAAGIFALKNNVERLKQDHGHAKQIADALKKKDFVTEILPVETNIVIFGVKQPWTAPALVEKLKEDNILGHPISPTQVRLVTHLDVTPEMVEKTIDVINKL